MTALFNNEETEYKTLKGRTLTWADNYLFYLCMNVYFKIVPYLIQTSTPPTTTTTTTSRRPTTTSWIVNNVVIPFLTSALSGLHASRQPAISLHDLCWEVLIVQHPFLDVLTVSEREREGTMGCLLH